VITPSLPTFFIASAMMLPMVESLFAEMLPSWAYHVAGDGLGELLDFHGLIDAALDSHRIRPCGDRCDAFAVDCLGQNRGRGGTVSGNVRGFRRHSRTIWAPMFSSKSFNSISLATVRSVRERRKTRKRRCKGSALQQSFKASDVICRTQVLAPHVRFRTQVMILDLQLDSIRCMVFPRGNMSKPQTQRTTNTIIIANAVISIKRHATRAHVDTDYIKERRLHHTQYHISVGNLLYSRATDFRSVETEPISWAQIKLTLNRNTAFDMLHAFVSNTEDDLGPNPTLDEDGQITEQYLTKAQHGRFIAEIKKVPGVTYLTFQGDMTEGQEGA
jgi:hypothetical protein